MANLHFKYGVMGSAKSADLIISAHNFRKNGTPIEVLKPSYDNRFGSGVIKSRAGDLSMDAVALPNLQNYNIQDSTKVVLIDEIQFFTPEDIDKLVDIVNTHDVRIICYGLLVDSNGHMFPASRHLQEVGARLTIMESMCQMPNCMHRATHHLRFDTKGNVIREGEQFALGDSNYKSVCQRHFFNLYHHRNY
ncbi:MAG: hypothetical protein J5742_03585 [Alphaproteobacteria bacterium]|nr:hypothetical protein [Alphaproteobacteria bacterium]